MPKLAWKKFGGVLDKDDAEITKALSALAKACPGEPSGIQVAKDIAPALKACMEATLALDDATSTCMKNRKDKSLAGAIGIIEKLIVQVSNCKSDLLKREDYLEKKPALDAEKFKKEREENSKKEGLKLVEPCNTFVKKVKKYQKLAEEQIESLEISASVLQRFADKGSPSEELGMMRTEITQVGKINKICEALEKSAGDTHAAFETEYKQMQFLITEKIADEKSINHAAERYKRGQELWANLEKLLESQAARYEKCLEIYKAAAEASQKAQPAKSPKEEAPESSSKKAPKISTADLMALEKESAVLTNQINALCAKLKNHATNLFNANNITLMQNASRYPQYGASAFNTTAGGESIVKWDIEKAKSELQKQKREFDGLEKAEKDAFALISQAEDKFSVEKSYFSKYLQNLEKKSGEVEEESKRGKSNWEKFLKKVQIIVASKGVAWAEVFKI